MNSAPHGTQPKAKAAWLTCPTCGASAARRPLKPGDELHCGRCGETLIRLHRGDPSHPIWALATAGVILCVMANVSPILTFDVAGNSQSNLIITGVLGLINQGFWPVAALIFFCAIAAPVLHFSSMWYVAGSCCLGHAWPGVRAAALLAAWVAPWSLVPVFGIACGVAVVKLDMLGTVYWDAGILWVGLLGLCSLLLAQIVDARWLERRINQLR